MQTQPLTTPSTLVSLPNAVAHRHNHFLSYVVDWSKTATTSAINNSILNIVISPQNNAGARDFDYVRGVYVDNSLCPSAVAVVSSDDGSYHVVTARSRRMMPIYSGTNTFSLVPFGPVGINAITRLTFFNFEPRPYNNNDTVVDGFAVSQPPNTNSTLQLVQPGLTTSVLLTANSTTNISVRDGLSLFSASFQIIGLTSGAGGSNGTVSLIDGNGYVFCSFNLSLGATETISSVTANYTFDGGIGYTQPLRISVSVSVPGPAPTAGRVFVTTNIG